MKIHRLFIIFLISIALPANLSAAGDVQKVNSSLENLAVQLNKVVPNSVSENNVYSDAWIGKFFPSLPMHFAIGIEGGITQFDISDLCTVAETFHIGGVSPSFLFPTVAVNGKLGGFGLPFDIGLSFFTADTAKMGDIFKGIDLNLFTIGGNLRIAILQGTGLCPVWSIGAGYYYTKGGIGTNSEETKINVNFETHTLIAETQISKKIIFITPFIGFRGIFVRSDSEYSWTSTTGLSDGTLVFKGTGSVSTDFKDDIIPQIFGGLGLSMGLVQLDTNVSYDFLNAILSGGISLRFKM